MKLAWLCYDVIENGGEIGELEIKCIRFVEPRDYEFYKIVPIVYAEIEE